MSAIPQESVGLRLARTAEEVRAIRTSPKMSVEVAAEYGVGHKIIGSIRRRETYKYVGDES